MSKSILLKRTTKLLVLLWTFILAASKKNQTYLIFNPAGSSLTHCVDALEIYLENPWKHDILYSLRTQSEDCEEYIGFPDKDLSLENVSALSSIVLNLLDLQASTPQTQIQTAIKLWTNHVIFVYVNIFFVQGAGEMYSVLPVDFFGRFFVALNFRQCTAFAIISDSQDLAKGQVAITYPNKTEVKYNITCHALNIHQCGVAPSSTTGWKITSNVPIGLVVATSKTRISKTPNETCLNVKSKTVLIEQLLPEGLWGRLFFYFHNDNFSVNAVDILVQSNKRTALKFDCHGVKTADEVMAYATKTIPFHSHCDAISNPLWKMIRSEDPVQVFVIVADDHKTESPEGGMLSLPPVELWGEHAFTFTPRYENFEITAYGLGVLPRLQSSELSSDLQIPNNSWDYTYTTSAVKVALSRRLQIGKRYKVTCQKSFLTTISYTRKSSFHFTFGSIYFNSSHALRPQLLQPGLSCEAEMGKTQFLVPEDGIDNDCDGLVDEELFNYHTDDLDELVDEDLGIVDGSWSHWQAGFYCSPLCPNSYTRGLLRFCNRPYPSAHGQICEGRSIIEESITCAPSSSQVSCPDECGPALWYQACNKTCRNFCHSVCDKTFGACAHCYPDAIYNLHMDCSDLTLSRRIELPEPLNADVFVYFIAPVVFILLLGINVTLLIQFLLTKTRITITDFSESDGGEIIISDAKLDESSDESDETRGCAESEGEENSTSNAKLNASSRKSSVAHGGENSSKI